jgi:hypothetical protein
MANEPDLSRLILDAKGARSYERMSADCGGNPTSKRLQQMATGPLKAFPDAETLEGIARGTGEPLTKVVLSAARSLGLRVYSSVDPNALVIGDASSLRPDQVEATRVLVRSFLASNRAARLEDFHRALARFEQALDAIAEFAPGEMIDAEEEIDQRVGLHVRLQTAMEIYTSTEHRLLNGDMSSEDEARSARAVERAREVIDAYVGVVADLQKSRALRQGRGSRSAVVEERLAASRGSVQPSVHQNQQTVAGEESQSAPSVD